MPDMTNGGYRKANRFKIILIYLVWGPPVGGLISTLMLSVWGGVKAETLQDALSYVLLPLAGLPIALPLSYLLGGVHALAVGVILYFVADEDGKFSYGWSIGAALITASVVGFALTGTGRVGAGLLLGIISIGTSVALRYFFRRRFGRDPALSLPD